MQADPAGLLSAVLNRLDQPARGGEKTELKGPWRPGGTFRTEMLGELMPRFEPWRQ